MHFVTVCYVKQKLFTTFSAKCLALSHFDSKQTLGYRFTLGRASCCNIILFCLQKTGDGRDRGCGDAGFHCCERIAVFSQEKTRTLATTATRRPAHHVGHDGAVRVIMSRAESSRDGCTAGEVRPRRSARRDACVTVFFVALLALSGVRRAATVAGHVCGTPANQPLVETRGVITTPMFPGPFPVPIECEWVIQANDGGEVMIEVYFTQLFVTDGLTITEYSQYPPDFGFVTVREVFNKSHISQYGQSMLTTLPYLVIRFRLDRLEGNHIRVHNDLMDVYGFNITYEMRPVGSERDDVCSLLVCSYSGNCLGNADLS